MCWFGSGLDFFCNSKIVHLQKLHVNVWGLSLGVGFTWCEGALFLAASLVNFLHVWGEERNHTLSCHVFLWSQSNLFLWWQPRHRRDWPRCPRSPRWPWFALVPRKFWHLPCDLTTIALVGPWVFWCQLKVTSYFWLLSCRPVLPRISQLIQPDKPFDPPGLSAGATPLVCAHHCKGKRGYWPNAEYWFLKSLSDSHWMILVGMCISVQACNSGQWTGMICLFLSSIFVPGFPGPNGNWFTVIKLGGCKLICKTKLARTWNCRIVAASESLRVWQIPFQVTNRTRKNARIFPCFSSEWKASCWCDVGVVCVRWLRKVWRNC